MATAIEKTLPRPPAAATAQAATMHRRNGDSHRDYNTHPPAAAGVTVIISGCADCRIYDDK